MFRQQLSEDRHRVQAVEYGEMRYAWWLWASLSWVLHRMQALVEGGAMELLLARERSHVLAEMWG